MDQEIFVHVNSVVYCVCSMDTSFSRQSYPKVFGYIFSQKPRSLEYLYSRTSSTHTTQLGTYYKMLGQRHVVYTSNTLTQCNTHMHQCYFTGMNTYVVILRNTTTNTNPRISAYSPSSRDSTALSLCILTQIYSHTLLFCYTQKRTIKHTW